MSRDWNFQTNMYNMYGKENGIRKQHKTKTTQVNLETWVSDEDLFEKLPSDIYWQVVAEKRKVALNEALMENQKLWILNRKLKKENTKSKSLLEEANSFIEVFKEVVPDNADDTGIEVGESSQTNTEERG